MISAALNRSNQANSANLEASLQENAPPALKSGGAPYYYSSSTASR